MKLDEKELEALELLVAEKARFCKQMYDEAKEEYDFYDGLLDKVLDLDN